MGLEDSIRPFEREANVYWTMLKERRFDDLEREAGLARSQDLKLSDGQPRLAAIYGGVAGCDCVFTYTAADWEERLRLLTEWRARSPKSVTAELTHALYFNGRAWAYRGPGFANTVKEDAWPLFRSTLQLAREHLQNASSDSKRDAGWYAGMLEVAKSQGWPEEEFRPLYEQAATQFPNYLPIYFAAAAYYSPRWHGSVERFKDLVEDAIKRAPPDVSESLYARLNWGLWNYEMFRNGQADWARMKLGFERMVAKYPDPWNVDNYAKFACLAGDMHTAYRLTRHIDVWPNLYVWGSRSRYDACAHAAEAAVQQAAPADAPHSAASPTSQAKPGE